MRTIRIATLTGFESRRCLLRRNGLALTQAPRGERGWTITHAASGRRVNYLSLMPLRQARIAFTLAAALGHWGDFEGGHVPPDHVYEALCDIGEMSEAA